MKNMCFSIALQVLATTASAQRLQNAERAPFAFFEHFGEDQGVPEMIGHIQQDRQGYLWGVHRMGLLRFDGVQFRSYTYDPDDPNSLPSNSIGDFLVDAGGLIWLATKAGMVRFDPVSERFSLVPGSADKPFISVFEDHDHRIWAGLNNAPPTFYDPQRDSMVTWKVETNRDGYTGRPAPDYFPLNCSKWAESADGTLWAAMIGATKDRVGVVTVAHVDPSRHTVEHFQVNDFLKKIGRPEEITPLAFRLDEKKQCLWLGCYGPGLLQFSLKTHEWHLYDLNPEGENDPAHNFIYTIHPKGDSVLWLGTNKGLKKFSIQRGTWTGFDTDRTHPWKAQPGIHLSIFLDKSGTTWFGHDKGLSRLDPYRQQFPKNSPLPLTRSHAHPLTFQAQAIAEYAPTGERLFAAWGDDGFFRVYAQHIQTNKIRQAKQRLPFRPNDVASVHQLFVAPDGRIWALLNRGIGWIDPVSLRLTIPDLPITNHTACRTPELWPRQMAADPDGNLWMATFGSGLIRYAPSTGQFWRPPSLPTMEKDVTREFNDFAFSIFCDTAGQIFWGEVGTGLELWDRKRQMRALFSTKAKNSRSFGGQVGYSIAQDKAGNMWFGTESGLCRYLPGASPDSAFERVRGMSELVYSIVPDRQGRLWLATPKGLVCYDPQRKTHRKFGEKEGMLVPITAYTPLFASSNGEIWLGDDLHFNPADIQLYPPAAVPLIVGFNIYDRAVPLPPPTKQGGQQVFPEIRLGPEEEVFSVEIGAFGFTAPEQTRLLYRLQADDPWQEAGTQRTFTFNRLPGGRYHFELKAIAPDGTDSGRSVILPLRVVPIFYRALWFWALCSVALGGGLYALARYREIQRLRQEQLRLRIARDLHDEVGSTLSSISILSASALRGVEKDLDAARFGNIGDKARAALDSISDIVWSVNPENDSMEKMLARMSVYASEMLENVGAELRFEVGEGVEALTLPMEKRKDFYLIFKEAIHNCAKYARAKKVEVAVQKDGETLVLRVLDNGIGFDIQPESPNSKLKTQNSKLTLGGNGLRNMRSRAAALGGSLEVSSAPGAGTEVRLVLPV
ncbi:MAG: two-component regulator propeller domain-containing protein [Saprospiraceae bacterium]